MTTVSALKDLYVKLGGTLADVDGINTVAEMIEAVKTVAGGGGGGGGALIVTFSRNQQNELECDTSISAIKQAFVEGKTVIGKYTTAICTLNTVYSEGVTFQTFDDSSIDPKMLTITGVSVEGEDMWKTEHYSLQAGEPFVATYTVTGAEGSETATCDKTYSDINAAITKGQPIVCKIAGNLDGQTSTYIGADGSVIFVLSMIDGGGGPLVGYGLIHASNDTILVVLP